MSAGKSKNGYGKVEEQEARCHFGVLTIVRKVSCSSSFRVLSQQTNDETMRSEVTGKFLVEP